MSFVDVAVNVQVHIEFTEEQDQIRLEGPPEDVEQAAKMLQDVVNDLVCHHHHHHFCCAMLCIARLWPSPVVRPSVCLSVRHVPELRQNKDIFKIFSPSGSDTILVFPYQRGCRYSDGNPLTGASNARGYDKMTIFSQISRCISETIILRWTHAA